ncbi:MAG TPA: hypothetical protein VMB24_06475, partial [Dehalococcoidales bacterium]|nr:hypothetical protein [Dehalococcoidales bacterium]
MINGSSILMRRQKKAYLSKIPDQGEAAQVSAIPVILNSSEESVSFSHSHSTCHPKLDARSRRRGQGNVNIRLFVFFIFFLI